MKSNNSARRSKVLGMLALPLATLAAVAVLLGLSLGTGEHAQANQPNANLEFTLHIGSANTVGDAKGNAAVAVGSTLVVSASLDTIPGPYDAVAVTLNYSGAIAGQFENSAKGNPRVGGHWPDCAKEAIDASTAGREYAACAVGVGSAGSTFVGTVFAATLTCATAGTGTVSLRHGPADTALYDHDGKISTDAGPDVINVTCQPQVGGIVLDPDTSALALQSDSSPGSNAWLLLTTGLAIATASAIAFGGGVWYVRRRRIQ